MLLKCYLEDKKTGATKHQHRQIVFGQELTYYWHGPNNHPLYLPPFLKVTILSEGLGGC